jgi:hypothetical protein
MQIVRLLIKPFPFLRHNRSNLIEDESNRSIEDIEQRLGYRLLDDDDEDEDE